MKERTPQEERAAMRQVQFISEALKGATRRDGLWLNPQGMLAPKIYPKGPAVSPFNALILQLATDRANHPSSQFVFFHTAKVLGIPVMGRETGVPFNWYSWDSYTHRQNPERVITAEEYRQLPDNEKSNYKGVQNRQIRILFNLEQTVLPQSDPERYEEILSHVGMDRFREDPAKLEMKTRMAVNEFISKIKENLVPIRREISDYAYYDSEKDAIYMPAQRKYQNYDDYVHELMRQVVGATGHRERLSREGMEAKHNHLGTPADRYERLVVEVGAALKMNELGLPGRISPQNQQLIEQWTKDLQESPFMLTALETDVNAALEVIKKAEQGEKIEYAKVRTQNAIEKGLPEQSEQNEASASSTILLTRCQLLKDDEGRWALFIKPENELSFSVYPDKDDVNRFFSTLRQGHEKEASQLREEMAKKYYLMATSKPEIKFNLFSQVPAGVDTSKIERVTIFKDRDGKIMCSAKIGGENLRAREITRDQWNRMFATDDMQGYKTALAAKVFADVLNPRLKEEKSDEKTEEQSEEQTHSKGRSM